MNHKFIVLVVEDHPGIKFALNDIVESWSDVALLSCDSFASAVSWLASAPHLDLLISDVRLLPGENTGIDLADIAVRMFPHLAVVVISGYPTSAIVGFTDRYTFLRKPFTQQELEDHIESSFKGFKTLIRG